MIQLALRGLWYYSLAYALPTIHTTIERLVDNRWKLGSAALGLSIALHCLSTWFAESTPLRHMLAGVSERKVLKTQAEQYSGTVVEAVHFNDGSLPLAYESVLVHDEELVGKVIRARDPNDAHKVLTKRTYKTTSPYEEVTTHEVCTEVVSGSQSGALARWRRGPGLLLGKLATTPIGFLLPITLLVIGGATAVVVLCISVKLVHKLLRLGRILWLSFTQVRSSTWEPAPKPSSAQTLLVQISDLHLTPDSQIPYEIHECPTLWPHGSPGPDTTERLKRLLRGVSASSPAPVLMTGDLTDLGAKQEHEVLREVWQECNISSRAILVPGNHDVAINVGPRPDVDLSYREQRESRFAQTISEIEPSAPTEWPRTFQLPGGEALLVALDSNRYPSQQVASNAIGLIGEKQLHSLRETLAQNARRPTIVAMHHHPARSSEVQFEDTFLIALDGKDLLKVLADHARTGAPVLVLHGHKHVSITQKVHFEDGAAIHICGHPSSTMGHVTRGQLDGHLRFSCVGYSPQSGWWIEEHRVCSSCGEQGHSHATCSNSTGEGVDERARAYAGVKAPKEWEWLKESTLEVGGTILLLPIVFFAVSAPLAILALLIIGSFVLTESYLVAGVVSLCLCLTTYLWSADPLG